MIIILLLYSNISITITTSANTIGNNGTVKTSISCVVSWRRFRLVYMCRKRARPILPARQAWRREYRYQCRHTPSPRRAYLVRPSPAHVYFSLFFLDSTVADQPRDEILARHGRYRLRRDAHLWCRYKEGCQPFISDSPLLCVKWKEKLGLPWRTGYHGGSVLTPAFDFWRLWVYVAKSMWLRLFGEIFYAARECW